MKPLIINDFKGTKTVKSNKGLNTNATFLSRLRDFQGKLSHSHYAIKFPVSGVEAYIVDNKAYHIDPKSYFVVNAGLEIEADIKSKNDVVGICVGFTKTYISDLAGSIQQQLEDGIDNPFATKNPINFILKKRRLNDDTLSQVLKKFKLDALENNLDNYETEQFYISLAELLILQEMKINSQIERLPHIKFSNKQEIYRRICLMNDYIHDNYKNDITLNELSQIGSLSKFHALRCYKKINNITPYRKILMLRLQEAKQLIQKGRSISEVAYETNFPDHRAFSKLFKQTFQMTPSQYKASVLK